MQIHREKAKSRVARTRKGENLKTGDSGGPCQPGNPLIFKSVSQAATPRARNYLENKSQSQWNDAADRAVAGWDGSTGLPGIGLAIA